MKVVFILLALLSVSACSVVEPGERGVRVILGKVSSDPKPPGPYFWFPFIAQIQKVDVQIQKSEVQASAASKDMQEITTNVVLNWRIFPEKAVELYETIGNEDDLLKRVIDPAVNEIMKSAIAKLTAEEALSRRMELKHDIDDALIARLSVYGIFVQDINIVNFTYSPEFTKAIEAKQVAEQDAKKAEYVAQEAIQTAHAEVNRAKGQAEAQALLRTSLTAEILRSRAIEKWDGKFPQVMGSGGALPFLDLKLGSQ